MQKKTRTLALGGVLAAVLGFAVVRPIYMAPIRDAEADLKSAERRLEQAQDLEFQLLQARERIASAQAASLPPSLNDAQRLYQEWITDLAQECRFATLTVSPGRQQGQRSNKYLAVGIELKGEADLEDLSRFLFQFEQADLVHRISSLQIDSTGTSGNPRLDITLTAEGLSVIGAEDKTELAARSSLGRELKADATVFSVADASAFPSKTPFLAKIGAETIRVVSVADGNWTVERGIGYSGAQDHAAGTVVRHFPVAWERKGRTFAEYDEFVKNSLFTKPPVPRTYKPRLAGLSDQQITPGTTATVTARIEDYNADLGEVRFELQDPTDGMQIDPLTGQFRYEAPPDAEPTDSIVTVYASQKNNEDLRLTDQFTVRVRLPNEPPELSLPESAVVLLGQPFRLDFAVTDDGGPTGVSLALEGDRLPEGLRLDERAGTLSWEPPLTATPGPQTITVKATDSGDPPQTITGRVQLIIRDDDARFTRFTAVVALDGQPEAWFDNLRTKTQQKLHVGDSLRVANIDAALVAIEPRLVRFRDEAGIWELAVGNHIRDRVLVEPAVPEETPTVAERSGGESGEQ